MAPRADFYVETDFRVVHEDEDLLVVDKPAPLPVNAVGSYGDLNLHTLLKKDPRWAAAKLRLTHRLDSETSGVLVIAKNEAAARGLGKQFMEGRVSKTYEALVFGRPAEERGEIGVPLGYDKSSGFQTVRVADAENGESARTRYEVLESAGEYSRVRLEPLTGRTHQLRAHMAMAGCPIVGDKIYVDLRLFERYVSGGLDADMLERLKLPRLALHAAGIRFEHPSTGRECAFSSPVPQILNNFFENARSAA